MRLGLKAPKHDPRTLKLARYLTPSLPTIPPKADWTLKVPNWLMYGNQQWGDCAMATLAEMIRIWTAADGVMQEPPTDLVIKTYLDLSPNDDGLVMLDVMKLWRSKGLLGHRIGGFAKVNLRDHHEFCAAIYLFGSVALGFGLPSAVDADHGLPDWRIPSRFHRWGGDWAPSSWGGHAVPAAKYGPNGFEVVTWGGTRIVDWAFLDEYGLEGYVAISTDWLGPDSKAPNGIDAVTLAKDIAQFPPAQQATAA